MKKKLLLILSCLLLVPLGTKAATQSTEVGYDLTQYQCSKLQDRSITTSDSVYFSQCMKATCNNLEYKLNYYSNNTVKCSNGNTKPYYNLYKNGCANYQTSVCNDNTVKYCSIVMYYDCNKKQDGSDYTTTTTKTKKPTNTKTTTTKAPVKSNTKLSSLTLSSGSIAFNSDTYVYNMIVGQNINSIVVNAVPEDSNSKVAVSGNDNISNGSVISIVVTGTDGSTSEYKINILKESAQNLSNNTRLKSLNVEDYNINFSPNINEYSVTIDEDIKELSLDYETEDSTSTVTVSGNNNLSNGSKVVLNVTAQDGTTGHYTLNIFVRKKSNIIKILFIIVLLLALAAGGYYMYNKFMANRKGDKYEYE